ncbi:MAG TPA: SUMF1/EgtB/PvdO family nonheme iron enzyme [Planctomycetota bacterium]|nr:SUMF1/EgtB/PvdO family nonheme iron enzyme [Planctomycetota bacterium]
MALKTWGDFEINFERLLGRGGMGAVYMGRQISLDRPSAIKILKQDLTSNPEFVKRFHREAALLARLVDNHVVQIFGAGEADGHHYYAMEYVEGDDYASMVRKGHKFTIEEVLKVGEAVGLALQAAWRHRIIHRDIKPSNILLTKEGGQTKVMDFGLAKNPESDLTESEVIMGTAKYMSPEQATGGACDIRSDLYSLGVVLYGLGAGQPPFVGEGATAIMYQHVHKQPKPPREINPAIPEEVEKIILRLMQKDPQARFATPEALVSAIRAVQEGVTPSEKSTLYNETLRLSEKEVVTEKRPSTIKAPPVKKSSVPLALSLVAGLMLIGAGGYFLVRTLSGDTAPKEPPRVAQLPPQPTGETPVKPPEPPPPLPPPPEPPKGTTEAAALEDLRQRGLEALGAQQWAKAYTLLEEAERRGAKDVTEKKLEARAKELIQKGDTEQDEEARLLHYEAARKFKDDAQLQNLIRTTSFRRWRKSAEKNEGGNWSKAADDWKRAVAFAEESEKDEAVERQRFCAKFSDAVTARTLKNWPKALELYKDLATNPKGQSATIESEIDRIEKEIRLLAEVSAKESRREYDELLEQGRQLIHRAVWPEAKAVYDRASEARFHGFPQEELKRGREIVQQALSAPPGMVYVPAGKFMMGGGRPVESPAGELSTAAFYIDDREVTVAQYAEFLAVLDSFGHTPACPKEEPPNKKHFPEDWDNQKGQDSVVGVDFWDANAYARWRQKRIPREAEWERAASFDPAGRRLYPWGPRYQKDGGKSYLGIEGLGSGVIEWTSDSFVKYPWSQVDPGEFDERKKVLRGGWLLEEYGPEQAKVTYRHWQRPDYRNRRVGFRCVMDMPEK